MYTDRKTDGRYSRPSFFFGTKCPKLAGARERRTAPRQGSGAHDFGQLFQQLGQRLPQIGIVLLQTFDVIGVYPAVGVGRDRHLIEIVGAPPLQGDKLPDGGQIDVEHIAV